MSLFLRIFLGFWLTMSVIALVAVFVSFNVADRAADAVFPGPRAMIGNAKRVLRREGREGLRDWLQELSERDPDGVRLLIVDETGNELLGRPVSRVSQRWLERERRGNRTEFALRGTDGALYRAVLAPPALVIGPLRLESLRTVIIVVALLVSAGVCYLLSRMIVAPIRAIDAAALRLSQGDLRARTAALTSGGTELASLSRQFNTMAEQVESLLTAQRELLRNVSHELRSPLARLRVALELARNRDGRRDDALTRIERETVRLDRLIGQILNLSRVTDSSAEIPKEPVELGGLINEIVADATYEGRARNLKIRTDVMAATILAEPTLLQSAIENVIRNALRFSPDGGVIDVSVRQDAGASRITIADAGPGVSNAHLRAIFEPFFRADHARTRAEDGAGDGVGLAITRAVIEQLGGSVSATNRAPSGLEVTLIVPSEPGTPLE
ncbi:MAG: ATP-binding protein [Pseudomonadota bacterium]